MINPEQSISPGKVLLSNMFTNFIDEFLIYSEWHLIKFMIGEGVWQTENFPQPPANWQEKGTIEAGIFLFLLNNPGNANKDALEVIQFLNSIITFSKSEISQDEYNQLDRPEKQLIYLDGSIISTDTFCTFDQNWIITIYNLWVTFSNGLFYNNRYIPIPENLEPFILNPDEKGQVLIGMTGDTGNGLEGSLLKQMENAQPACMIHLGDVYYAGTPSKTPTRGDVDAKDTYIFPGEELANLVNLWPNNIPSFTMNSNHEMYSGGNGLFLDALTSAAFSNQRGCSMFAIKVADWFILGLDSAFYSEMDELFMYGRLHGSMADHPFNHNRQLSWIEDMVKANNIDPNKTIILTHHNAFDYACGNTAKYETKYYQYFWQVLRERLGGDPYAWYWGHIHNAIAYQSPLTIHYPQTTFKTNTYCRCIGNGSIPYGTATALLNDPDSVSKYQWFAGQKESPKILEPGYGNLQFQISDGVVDSICETIFIGKDALFNNQLFNRQASK